MVTSLLAKSFEIHTPSPLGYFSTLASQTKPEPHFQSGALHFSVEHKYSVNTPFGFVVSIILNFLYKAFNSATFIALYFALQSSVEEVVLLFELDANGASSSSSSSHAHASKASASICFVIDDVYFIFLASHIFLNISSEYDDTKSFTDGRVCIFGRQTGFSELFVTIHGFRVFFVGVGLGDAPV